MCHCGNVRCSTAIRNMFDKGQVKIANWKWNYSAHASNNYSGGGSSASGVGYSSAGGGNTTTYSRYGGGYGGGYAGFSPMPPSGPSVACPVHGGYNPAPLPPFLQPYHNTGSGYYQGYSNPPFFPPFPPYGGGSQGCPPPTIVVRYRR
ncbi:hypothetical protein NEUTE1DRAFT_106542 [Neurospora tetrasperma FGSC 2508]|uniref:Uncharacterized protein n=1 Tax=Neurospora tetrasperma (strain FGSC 2508 / ATCC MYA-4615 / P0657) TaxID=510951 RepID=F8MZ57_NEUT8|nr:uncharacterized protein NEUTE1DRAFT_106542 [Neurospora tetrasperma FGSC 2508]EGO53649.1 hypothetical protein NEUTE1DRAFT_106542 [Neurospora tetrasperma FGSC 2508]